MLRIGRSIVGLFIIIWLFFVCLSASPVEAEEAGVRYQFLNSSQGLDTVTWTLKLELWNLSGNDINNLSLNLLTSLPFMPDQGLLDVGILSTTNPQLITADFTVPTEYLPPNEMPLRFYVKYETADGIPRSAVIEGQLGLFMMGATP